MTWNNSYKGRPLSKNQLTYQAMHQENRKRKLQVLYFSEMWLDMEINFHSMKNLYYSWY